MRYMMLIALALVGVQSAADINMGTNVFTVSEWSSEIPFCNALYHAYPWFSGTPTTWTDGRPLDVDTHGYVRSLLPGQVARTIVLSGAAYPPEGEYVFEHNGDATFVIGGSGKLLPNGNIQVIGTAGVQIMMTRVSPANYPTVIKLWLPNQQGHLFNSQFLESVRPYHVIRFMNWMHTNGDGGTTKPDCGTMEDFTWANNQGGGVPIEVCLALCDEIRATPWFCIHHLADDAYVARLVDRVGSRRAIYEHSNEVWNGQFKQSQWCNAKGVELGLNATAWYAGLMYHAKRTREIKAIVAGRGTTVLGCQAASVWAAKEMLKAYPQCCDALAIAPYFGEYTTIQELHTLGIPKALARIDGYKTYANSVGLGVMLYECGQHLIGYTSMQATPEMGQLYHEYFDGIASRLPGVTACHFTNVSPYGKYGDWGTAEKLSALDTPKRAAVLSYCKPKLVTQADWLQEAGRQLKAGDMGACGDALIRAGEAEQ